VGEGERFQADLIFSPAANSPPPPREFDAAAGSSVTTSVRHLPPRGIYSRRRKEGEDPGLGHAKT